MTPSASVEGATGQRLQCLGTCYYGILSDGDSITAGSGLSGFPDSSSTYQRQAIANLRPDNISFTTAVGGYTSAQIIAHLSGVVLPQLSTWSSRGISTVYTLMVGANDIFQSVPVATTYTNIQSICASVTGAGAQMVVLTVLPAATVNETNRQSLNTLIRAGGACPYTLADPGNDPTIGQAGQYSNATYYQSDQVHPTAAGDAIIGNTYLLPALQSLGVR